ncbi:MAG TPA: P-loop NTPase fold protein [Verrucomicrobiae bacterium]|nr:P-loop NTPase fold protein [Verrucomicrobiae bacterium]
MILAVLPKPSDDLGKARKYACRNWRAFGVSALAAFALSLLFARAIFGNRTVRDAAVTHSLSAVLGAGLLLVALLIAATGPTRNFLLRARRTWMFQDPPLQYLHVALTWLLFAALGAMFSPLPKLSTEVMVLIGASVFVLAVWVVALWIASRKEEMGGKINQKQADFSLFPDDPISDEFEDCLHRAEFTDELHRLILTLPFKESFVISLNGPWGSGKTSILRFLAKRLKPDPKGGVGKLVEK